MAEPTAPTASAEQIRQMIREELDRLGLTGLAARVAKLEHP
jgi:hypothetical protein